MSRTPRASARRPLPLARRRAALVVVAVAASSAVAPVGSGGSAAAANGVLLANPSFESEPPTGGPATCWQRGHYGSGSSRFTGTRTAHSGSRAGRLRVTSLASGANRKVVVDQRDHACAPSVTPGHQYTVSVNYRATTRPRMVLYYRDAAGRWRWWDQGSASPRADTWTKLSFTTAPVPAGATALSFGPSVSSTGRLLVDDATMVDRGPEESPAPSTPPPTTDPAATVRVATSSELTSALARAEPGTTIALSDGTYSGRFTLSRSGTASAPIRVVGGRGAVLDGGSTANGYVLHLDRADHVRLEGFTVRGGQKSVVIDESSNDVLTGLDLGRTGCEVVLLRNFSRDNLVEGNEIHDSGLATPGYGEGVYIGLSASNWSSTSQSRTGGAPDTSDRNRVVGNHIVRTTAESVDVKEGTTGGVVAGNTFDATGLSGANYADSWVDVAGNGYRVEGNTGLNPGGVLLDGFQTHVIRAGWGEDNVFAANTGAVDAAGYGINIHTKGSGNVVRASNSLSGAGRGLSNVAVSP